MVEFDIIEYLNNFQDADKESYPAVQNPSEKLNFLIDKLAVSPESIDNDQDLLEDLIDFVHSFPQLPATLQTQLIYLISSSLANLAKDIHSTLDSNENYNDMVSVVPQIKQQLEEYGYLIHVLLTDLQLKIHKLSSKMNNASNMPKSTEANKNSSSTIVGSFKNACNQLESLLESLLRMLDIDSSKIFQTTPEKNQFCELFLKPLFLLIEVEATTKVSALKIFVMKTIATMVKHHGQGSSVHNSIMNNLTYFLHLSNFNAELLHMLDHEYNHTQLIEDILKDIVLRSFSAKDTTGPKIIANFFIKLSELSPTVMLRQMSLIIRLLNNSSITLRCSIVEACGNICTQLLKNPNDMDRYKQQISVLIELLQERFQDSNPYVRTKAIQGCIKVCDFDLKITAVRAQITRLSVRSLQDRSSLVRRNSIKLLCKLILKHPFADIHGTQLKYSQWESRLSKAKGELAEHMHIDHNKDDSNDQNGIPPVAFEAKSDQEAISIDSGTKQLQELEQSTVSNETSPESVLKLKLLVVYYGDALAFIKELHKGIELSSNLLFSKNRNEVIEVMDFLVLAEAYDIEVSYKGIKKMLHLVWMKGANEEGASISSHLVSCYKQLFLTTPEYLNHHEKAKHVATNLIDLTIGASIADLASLEQLICLMYKEDLIDGNVINVLWSIYSSRKNSNGTEKDNEQEHCSKDVIQGSIIILAMLALANSNIAQNNAKLVLKVGLNSSSPNDLVLARYSCLTLERMVQKGSTVISHTIPESVEDEAVTRLFSMIMTYTEDTNYYPMCEQAISALFNISSEPDLVCAKIIKEKTVMTFGKRLSGATTSDNKGTRTVSLSQLLFIVGQVAIRTLVYLEKCEAEFKRKKLNSESVKHKTSKNVKKATDQPAEHGEQIDKENELKMIGGGTNEDDFMDAILSVKENELLYGENSLLGKFCPIVEEIVSNADRFADSMLQRNAALCLEKLMCISSKYCEKSLPLLITVMEKSPDPIIRSNAILGLGDMAVCFNNLVDENTDYLYRRLHDENIMVQKTCLMTVTFLILGGQVKVKGQLGEMAKCLDNPDQGISDMCYLFFTELATKDNAIYNSFTDIFSNLTVDDQLSNESFKKIIKFLVAFVDKERYQKQLSEKLYNRLINSTTQKQWDDVAFVLNCIPFKTEKISQSLEEGFKYFVAKQ